MTLKIFIVKPKAPAFKIPVDPDFVERSCEKYCKKGAMDDKTGAFYPGWRISKIERREDE